MDIQESLIEKLFRSECTQRELIELLNSMENYKNNNYEEIMQKLWIELEEYPSLQNEHSELILENALSKINSQEKPASAKLVSINRPAVKWLKLLAVAASILIVAGGVSWDWYISNKTITVTTAYAETKTINLPDESIVQLNAASQLSYSPNWCNTCDRQVMLIGEAHFEVEKKEQTGQKFQVITNDLTIEVLGTVFNVNTLHDQTEVFLEEGQVKLDFKEEVEEMHMVPGDVVTYSIQTKKREKQYFKKDESIVWSDSYTSMQNIPLSKILQKVEDIYGESFIVVNDDHLDRKFTIGIPINNFETTLAVLKEVTKLNIVKTENNYMVK